MQSLHLRLGKGIIIIVVLLFSRNSI